MADGGGESGFAFAVPAPEGWAGALASVTLSGPGGSATLDEETGNPMAILRNARTGEVTGFLRDLPTETLTREDAMAVVSSGPGTTLRFSRGFPARTPGGGRGSSPRTGPARSGNPASLRG